MSRNTNYYVLAFLTLMLGLTACKKMVSDSPAGQNQRNLCNAEDVKEAIHPGNKEFSKWMKECGHDALGDEKETFACLSKHYPKVSEGCRSCFARMTACGAEHCKFQCMTNDKSKACVKCVNKNCREDRSDNTFSILRCTGLKQDQLP